MQHRSRSAARRDGIPGARLWIATCDGVPVGRRVDVREDGRLHLIDLAVTRAWRRRGLAGALLDGLIAEAREAGLPVTLNVDPLNAPALALYRTRGFTVAAASPPHLLMHRGTA
ncbi:MAG: GNAT family N-acetyltransferase [Methylobacterium frigidaeris]